MSEQKISCLHSVDHQDNTLVSLENKPELSLGRALSNDVCLNKSNFISRQHAKIVKENGEFSIIDLNSGNGVFVNSKKITPAVPTILRHKDLLELGKDPATGVSSYKFFFYTKAAIRFGLPTLRRLGAGDNPMSPSVLRRQFAEDERLLREKMAEQERCLEERRLQAEQKQKELENRLYEMSEMLSRKDEKQQEMQQELETNLLLLNAKESELTRERSEKILAIEARKIESECKIVELEKMLDQKEKENSEELQSVLEEKENIVQHLKQQKDERLKMEEEGKSQQLEFEQIKLQLERSVSNMNEQLSEKEKNREELSEQVEQLMSKQYQIEDEFSKEKAKLAADNEQLVHAVESKLLHELEMQKNAMRDELSAQINLLIDQKTEIENMLVDQTVEKVEESMRVDELRKQQQELTTKLESLEQKHKEVDFVEDVMEEELVCTICSELFIKAMSLSCSHSFCHCCIVEWMMRKTECPNCRTAIKTCVPCIVLDNTINRMLSYMNDDIKTKRETLVNERKVEQAGLDSRLEKYSKREKIYRLLNKQVPNTTLPVPRTARGSVDNPILLADAPPMNMDRRNLMQNFLQQYVTVPPPGTIPVPATELWHTPPERPMGGQLQPPPRVAHAQRHAARYEHHRNQDQGAARNHARNPFNYNSNQSGTNTSNWRGQGHNPYLRPPFRNDYSNW